MTEDAGPAGDLRELTDRLGWLFGRPEPRAAFTAFVQALVDDVPRKNSWGLAKHAAYSTARPFEHLLNGAVWDVEALRSVVRDLVDGGLGHADAVLVVGDVWAVKQGTRSVGVARQRTGHRGAVENCQAWVTLSLASRYGHALIDRELYLPLAWTEGPERCAAAGVPADRAYASKAALAAGMVDRARSEQVGFRWVVAGREYAADAGLREHCHQNTLAYVFEADDGVPVATAQAPTAQAPMAQAPTDPAASTASAHTALPDARRDERKPMAGALGEADSFHDRSWAWHRIGIPGQAPAPGFAHWLMLGSRVGGAVAPDSTRDGTRDGSDRYLVHAPVHTQLSAAALAAGLGRTVLHGGRDGRDGRGPRGLDQYQVRKWVPTYRHITICMLADAFLATERAARRRAAVEPEAN